LNNKLVIQLLAKLRLEDLFPAPMRYNPHVTDLEVKQRRKLLFGLAKQGQANVVQWLKYHLRLRVLTQNEIDRLNKGEKT